MSARAGSEIWSELDMTDKVLTRAKEVFNTEIEGVAALRDELSDSFV